MVAPPAVACPLRACHARDTSHGLRHAAGGFPATFSVGEQAAQPSHRYGFQPHLEVLEQRLAPSSNSAPILQGVSYEMAVDTPYNLPGLMAKAVHVDPDTTLTITLVSGPTQLAMTNLSQSAGTATLTQNTQGWTGTDFWVMTVSDGSLTSNPAIFSVSVGGHTGARTNLDENVLGESTLFAGALLVEQELVLGQKLVYNSLTMPRPIVVVETGLRAGSAVPTSMKAKLTINGGTQQEYTYSTSGLTAGSPLRFALQADAGLATGRYPWTMTISCVFDSGTVTRDYTGHVMVESRVNAPFGAGFWLHDLDRIVTGTGGVQLVLGDGTSLWFPDNGTGGYLPAEGDQTFSTLVKHGDNTFTRTFSTGDKTLFNTSGLQTSRVTAAGLATTYTYTNGVPTQISDPFSRNTTLTYTSGLLSGITDFASRAASLSYSSGKLSTVTLPDPDGAGSLTAPVTSFAYDGSTSLLTSVTLPDPDGAGSLTSPVITYTHTSHRLATVSHSGGGSITLTPMQRVGLPTGTSGNSLTAPSAAKTTLVDPRNKTWEFKFDRFGNAVSIKDPLSNVPSPIIFAASIE